GEADEIHIAFEIGRLGLEMLHHPLALPVERVHGGWQQSFEPEFVTLLERERRALVANGIVQQRLALSVIGHVSFLSRFQWVRLPAARAISDTESERTPWAP